MPLNCVFQPRADEQPTKHQHDNNVWTYIHHPRPDNRQGDGPTLVQPSAPVWETSSATWMEDSHTTTNHTCSIYSLQDSRRDLYMLNKHPAVKSVSLRFNSTIPPSAPVERLFSTGAIILSKRRNRLNDDTFEKLLLLKLNSEFW